MNIYHYCTQINFFFQRTSSQYNSPFLSRGLWVISLMKITLRHWMHIHCLEYSKPITTCWCTIWIYYSEFIRFWNDELSAGIHDTLLGHNTLLWLQTDQSFVNLTSQLKRWLAWLVEKRQIPFNFQFHPKCYAFHLISNLPTQFLTPKLHIPEVFHPLHLYIL